MRMIMIAALALLVVGGGAAGAYFYFMKPAEAAAGAEAAQAKEKAEAAKKEEGGHGGESLTQFVKLDPLILPIIDENGVTQVISLVVALEVESPEAAGKVELMSPRLKDAFIQDMYGALSEKSAMKAGVIQVAALKIRLNKITMDVMGKDTVHDVLLQVVQQRPI